VASTAVADPEPTWAGQNNLWIFQGAEPRDLAADRGAAGVHWHPNADEWQYYLRGQARMTVFNTGPKATTNDFRPGDVGVVRKNLGRYVENTGSDILQFLEVFRTNKYEEVSLAEWLGHARLI
jgi:oxalate decarboxylase/phosphoglucose isomerase-like protein (cupin superfamily)